MPTLTERDRVRLRYLCDRSFFHFCRIVGGHVNQGGDLSESVHRRICDFIQDPALHRKAYFMPRAWRKSTMGKWYDIWRYLHNHEIRVLIVSENVHLATRFHDFIQQQAIRNEMLRWLYPELAGLDKGYTRTVKWNSQESVLPRQGIYSEATYTCIGIGGAAQSGHYDLIHIDDPVGKKAMESPIVLEGVLRWIDNMSELLVNPDPESPYGSDILMAATFWSPADAGNYIREKYSPPFQIRITPALHYSAVEDTPCLKWIQHPDQPDDETNYPENPEYSTAYYRDMMVGEKAMVFWTQHMNMPGKSSGLTKFDKDWIRYYRFEEREDGKYVVCLMPDGSVEKGRDGNDEAFRVKDIPIAGMIDPGGFAETKMIKRGSRNAIVIGGQPRDSLKKFVLYTWAGRLKEPSLFIDEVFKAHEAWKPGSWRIETIGAQMYIYKDIREASKVRGIAIPMIPMPQENKKNEKDDDIQALINPMHNGEIYLHESMKELRAEICAYPNGLTVDLLDMCSKLFKYGYWGRRRRSEHDEIFGGQGSQEHERGRSSMTGY